MSDGKLLLEAKEDMRKRGLPSPDEADAVALCFSEPEGSPFPRSNGFNRKNEYADNAYAEVKQVTAIVSNPGSDPNDRGRVTIGHYILQDDL